MKRWISAAVTALGLLWIASPAFAAGLIIVEDARWWPGPVPPQPAPPLWPPPHPFPPPRPRHICAPLDVTYVKVHTRITDQLAVTSIEQEFFNPNAARLEGTFVFPIPKGAHLDKFSMEIDGKQVQAELLPADKARKIYEDIVRKLKDPALLEYAGQDIFKARIFPIEPNSKKRITLSYSQLLKSDDGLVSYVLPLNTEKFSARPIRNVSVKVDLETRRPLKSIYSPSHSVEVRRDGTHRATAGYEANDVQPDTDFALYFSQEKDEIGMNLLTFRERGEDGYFLLLASPGMDVKEKQIVQKDIVFVLDTSGSMAGKKLEQAKKALQFCVENLNEGDRFEILRFSTEVEPLFDKLVEATAGNRSKAGDFIKALKPIGGTAIDDALKKALSLRSESRSDRPLILIFLTDGRPTIGITDDDRILANVKDNNKGRNRIFCFGIGTDVNTHLLDKITEETRAFTQYVLPEEDLEVKVSSFFAKIKEPVLANPYLKVTGDVRVTKLYPSPLPDIFKGEQLVLVGRFSSSGDSAVIIEGTVNGELRKFTYDARFSAENAGNEFIPRLWAMRRVGYLLDEIRLHGENTELKDEVTDLARKYGIVTPYTAYLIVEDEKQRNVPAPMQSMRDFGADREAFGVASSAWRRYNDMSTGEAAVAGARQQMAFKSANAPAAAAAGGALESRRVLGLTATPASPGSVAPRKAEERLDAYSQQTRFVSGRNFFQNNQGWIDSEVQKHPNAKRVRVQFASQDYFDLIAKNPLALPWLAQGQNVQFFLKDIIYEVYE